MKIQFILFYSLLLLTSISGCTEKFYPEIDEDVSVLIVDGKITNGIGSCEVRLFRTVKFTDNYDLKPEMDATITLHDNQNRTEILTEYKPGVYHNSSLIIKGEVGSTYWIEIQTLTGEKYESIPELMPATFETSRFYGEEIEVITNNSSKKEGVRIYFDATNKDNTSSYIRWEFRESYEWHSPFRKVKPYTANPSRICYPVNTFNQINIFDASNFSIKEIDHLPISTIFNHEVKLLYNYLLDLKIYSISQQNYIFWDKVKSINQSNGSLYDVIPANIIGNISACSGKCQVMGYFEVSSVNTSQRIFNQSDFNTEFADFPEECNTFTMVLEDNLKPDITKYHIVSSEAIFKAIRYTVRLNECYECNIKYPVNKPSFWP